MVWCPRCSLCRNIVFILLLRPTSWTEIISTASPVPPLQWINLTASLRGSPPPPLKDASIGYDETSRSLLIFGGESESGFAQGQTFLLNLDTLTWSTPTPPPNLQATPAARSGALGGGDFAASNRHGHILIGGKGSDGKPLSDIWEYDYINQFWSEVNVSPVGPSARWGTSGGIDIRTTPISDAVVPGPNNTFYLAGGFDGTTTFPLSDVWRLNVSGTLSSNLPHSVQGAWQHLGLTGNLPNKVNQASTIVSQQIIVASGCHFGPVSNNSCAQSDAYVIDTATNSAISPGLCPAPRSNAVFVPNFNTYSSSFSSQVFLLLGTFDTLLWQDSGGLEKGEVAILDINTGTWSRVIPSGDPGVSGNPSFPSPREGAAAFSFSSALVGQSRGTASDTIVFGGQDASGVYFSEVWLLRAYNGSVSRSDQKWSGFADGKLQTGVNANGAGVTVQFITTCASSITQNSTNPAPPSTTTIPPPAEMSKVHHFDTSLAHKLLAPLSVALTLLAVLLYRLTPSSNHLEQAKERTMTSILVLVASVAYATGIAGVVLSFTTITSTSTFHGGSPDLSRNLKTGHGKAGLTLFVCVYGVVPLFLLLSSCRRFFHDKKEQAADPGTLDSTEKAGTPNEPMATPPLSVRWPSTTSSSPFPRLYWRPSTCWPRSRPSEAQPSSDTESVDSDSTQQRGFEVVNRPPRTGRINRHSHGNHLSLPSADSSIHHRTVRSLGDVDWLERRRTLNAVGELDYAISQSNRQRPPTPATLVTLPPIIIPPQMPHIPDMILRLLFYPSLLGLCILSLVALWSRAPRSGFIIFLLWTLVFYISIFVLAWHGRPYQSVLAVMAAKLRTNPKTTHDLRGGPVCDQSSAVPTERHHSPFESRGPYSHHQPPYRAALSVDYDDTSVSHSPRSVDMHDDEDEDTRQRMIEEEMGRRDVSIITVPKRKLFITNAS